MKKYIFFAKIVINICVVFFMYKFLTTDFFGKSKMINTHKHCVVRETNTNPFLDNDLIEHSHDKEEGVQLYRHSHSLDPMKNNKLTKLNNTELLEKDFSTPFNFQYALELEYVAKIFTIILLLLSLLCCNYAF